MEKFLKEVEDQFLVRKIKGYKPIVTGNINYTYLIEAEGANYILQRINKTAFTKPQEVMQNIRRVNRFLERKVLQEGGNPTREVLHPINTLDGSRYLIDEQGEYWRMYNCIENAKTYDTIDSPDMFYKVGRAFGKFQQRLIDFPAVNLHEAIPDFHNTPKRMSDFELAIIADKAGRLEAIKGKRDDKLKIAIDQILAAKDEVRILELGKMSGKLPIRVTHNDTKINNVMIDNETEEPICVIDFDTIGPDTALVDYGDAIRSGANKSGEAPEKIEDAVMDMELFKAYTKGYLDETLVITNGEVNDDPKKGLTKNEVALLHKAPRILALELAMRFLGDYLNGDEYFRLKEGQPKDFNLYRALAQINLATDMKQKEEEMKKFIDEYIAEKIKNSKSIEELEGDER